MLDVIGVCSAVRGGENWVSRISSVAAPVVKIIEEKSRDNTRINEMILVLFFIFESFLGFIVCACVYTLYAR